MGTATIQERMTALLIEHGMWPEDAAVVIQKCMSDDDLQPLQKCWSDSSEGYPSYLLAAIWQAVQRQAGVS